MRRNYLHLSRNALQSCQEIEMASPAQRMKAMRERRASKSLREVRLALPDARSLSVRRRIAAQIAKLRPSVESEAMDWIESISEFDERA